MDYFDALIDRDLYRIEEPIVKPVEVKYDSANCWSNYTSLDEFEGMILAMTQEQLDEEEASYTLLRMAD